MCGSSRTNRSEEKGDEDHRDPRFTGVRALLMICSHVTAHADILELQKATHAEPKLEAALFFSGNPTPYLLK